MSSNEGSLEGGGGGGVKPDTSEGRSGSVGISGVGAPATTAAEGGAPAVASGSVDLMLYTACEEGFVKTWRVGERKPAFDKRMAVLALTFFCLRLKLE